jgi:hypothetical protein
MEGYGGSDDWIRDAVASARPSGIASPISSTRRRCGTATTRASSAAPARRRTASTEDLRPHRGPRRAPGRRALEGCARARSRATPITVDDLEGTAAAQGVEVERGDLLLVRTGHMTRYLDRNDWALLRPRSLPGRVRVQPRPGCTPRRSRRWPATTTRSRCGRRRSSAFAIPSTSCAIPNMGLTLGEIFISGSPRGGLRGDGRWTFPARRPPAAVTPRGRHPINPYALK